MKNSTGFVGNRMMLPYMYEAQFLVEDGATPEQVDRVLTSFGMAMGIFAVDDLGGLDVAWRIRKELNQFSEPGARRPLVADALVEMNRLGQKTGKGWYTYEASQRKAIPDPAVDALIAGYRSELGVMPRVIDDEEIVGRCVLALVNEGARLLEEGIALRASDIDVVYIAGYGFPRYRGGPMFHADLIGLPRAVAMMRKFAANPRADSAFWQPAPLLARLAAEGRTFSD